MNDIRIENILQKIDKNICLDKQQIDIVLDESDYLLVVAAAGSGKTCTIVAKVLYLIEYKKVKPEDILLISFTNETVSELRKQIQKIMNYSVFIMTFHKLGLEIIKSVDTSYKILSNKRDLIETIIKSLWKYDIIFKQKLCHFFNVYISIKNEKRVYKNNNFDKIKTNKKYDIFLDIVLSFLDKKEQYESVQHTIKHKLVIKRKYCIFLELFQRIEEVYKILIEKHHLYDFNHMITEATELLKTKHTNLNYKYIFVDEYQDISHPRFLLLCELVKITGAKLTVVGDDWQSIYHFSGSDITLFTEFQSFFPSSTVKFLTMTYRNSNQLIRIAGKFIMKNNKQIKKTLQSTKNIDKPIQYYYYNKHNFHIIINKILDAIVLENEKQEILILGRYKHDEEKLYGNKNLKKICSNRFQYKNYNKMNIIYLTIHASKGLGFDQVIIINLEDGIYGFPSKVSNSSFLSIIEKNSSDQILEERRLFYVALTRTKNRVYICIPHNKFSIFIHELKKLK